MTARVALVHHNNLWPLALSESKLSHRANVVRIRRFLFNVIQRIFKNDIAIYSGCKEI